MEIRTYETIDAPVERVWELLADFDGYPAWNPMMRISRGHCAEGAKLRLWLRLGPARVPVSAEVLVAQPGRELRWVGPALRWGRMVASGEHFFTLTELGPKQTRIEHGETFRGALVPARSDRVEGAMRPAYEAFNRALKRRAEAR